MTSSMRTFAISGVLTAVIATPMLSRAVLFRMQSALECRIIPNGTPPIPINGVYGYPGDIGLFDQNSWLACPVRDDAHFRASNASFATVWGVDGTRQSGDNGAFTAQACALNWADDSGGVCGLQWSTPDGWTGELSATPGGNHVDTSAWRNFPSNFAYLIVTIPDNGNQFCFNTPGTGRGCSWFVGYGTEG